MAEQDDSKTEKATGRRKAEARQKGQVAISREVPTAVILMAGVMLLYAMATTVLNGLARGMREWLTLAPHLQVTQDSLHGLLVKIGGEVLMLLLPVVAGVALLGAASYLVQTGFLWSHEGLKLDLTRLNPLTGMKRFFTLRAVVEGIKSLLKIALIGTVGFFALRNEIAVLPGLVTYDLAGILSVMGALTFKMALWIGVTVMAIAAIDYVYQRYEWERGLRMSRTEIKMEHKESEGDPQIKSRIRSLQREMARNRMMAAVPKADVVITNPTHLAVALQYDHESMEAPVVVAKGAGFVAERIREIAKEHGVMVVENKLVARSLFKLVDIGKQIPADLYRAVAEILALVYRAKGRGIQGRGGRA
jgi:flagellar biosynthetic protein FlhB